MQKHAIGAGTDGGEQALFRLARRQAVTDEGVGEYGRIFDVIAVGRPASGIQQPRKSTLEWALFECGRPLLIAPPQRAGKARRTYRHRLERESRDRRAASLSPCRCCSQRKMSPVMMVPGTRLPGPDENELVDESQAAWRAGARGAQQCTPKAPAMRCSKPPIVSVPIFSSKAAIRKAASASSSSAARRAKFSPRPIFRSSWRIKIFMAHEDLRIETASPRNNGKTHGFLLPVFGKVPARAETQSVFVESRRRASSIAVIDVSACSVSLA